jgi:hypothetical protein
VTIVIVHSISLEQETGSNNSWSCFNLIASYSLLEDLRSSVRTPSSFFVSSLDASITIVLVKRVSLTNFYNQSSSGLIITLLNENAWENPP